MKKINIFLNILLISIYAMPVIYGMENNLYNSFTELKLNFDNDINSFENANNNFQKIDSQTWYNFINSEELESIYDILNSSNQTTNEIQYNEYQLSEGVSLPTKKIPTSKVNGKYVVCQTCYKKRNTLSIFKEEEIVNHLATHISYGFCDLCLKQDIIIQQDHIAIHLNELNKSSNYLSLATPKQIKIYNDNMKKRTTINKDYVSCKICVLIKGIKSLFPVDEIEEHIRFHIKSDKFCTLCNYTINDDKEHIEKHINAVNDNSSTSSLIFATHKQVMDQSYNKRKKQRKGLTISDQTSIANNGQPDISNFNNLARSAINLETPAKKQRREKEHEEN